MKRGNKAQNKKLKNALPKKDPRKIPRPGYDDKNPGQIPPIS